ncbi:MAG: hypothetical protein R3E95_13710 [Thiolinea sp.]
MNYPVRIICLLLIFLVHTSVGAAMATSMQWSAVNVPAASSSQAADCPHHASAATVALPPAPQPSHPCFSCDMAADLEDGAGFCTSCSQCFCAGMSSLLSAPQATVMITLAPSDWSTVLASAVPDTPTQRLLRPPRFL